MKWTKHQNYWGISRWECGQYTVVHSSSHGWVVLYPFGQMTRHWFAFTARRAAERHMAAVI